MARPFFRKAPILACAAALVLLAPAAHAHAPLPAWWANCKAAFSSLTQKKRERPALRALVDYLRDPHGGMDTKMNSFRVVKGRRIIDIGLVQRGQRALFTRVLKALREGSIDEIQAGQVVGPKVLSLLHQLADDLVKHPHARVEIRGNFVWRYIDAEGPLHPVHPGRERVAHWSPPEIAAHEKAEAALRFDECRKASAPDSSQCSFVLTIEGGSWSIRYQ
jgi:hypothetical protein